MTTTKLYSLQPGDRFLFTGASREFGEFELLRLSLSGATVQRCNRKERDFETRLGEHINFHARNKPKHVGLQALVEKIQ